jgi:RNA polymerase sigma-70 factor (ECF subfamily)
MVKEDVQVVERVLSGDKEAFSSLVKRYHARVSALAYSQVNNLADAEDIAQEAFVRAYRSLPSLKDPGKFASWVARITVNTSRDFLRERVRKHIPLEDLHRQKVIDLPVAEAIKKEEQLDKVITSVMAELPEDIQGVVALRFFERLTYNEIAEFLDLPVSTVRGALYRGTKYLRKRLKPFLQTN